MPDIARLTASLADRYRIERELGAGGMATVYLAQDLKHDRKVAVKVLRPDLAAALGADRFLSEIKTTANLQHPHILPLHDSGEAGGFLFYVMPFVEGESLRDRLNRETQLPIDDALRIATEAASALDYAHRHGVIHRDIKPENILLHDGSALVADFGIALAVQSAGGQRLTQTGLSLGTPQYMSPEQAMGEKSIDARSDVYALGAVTYEMLTGEPPFTGPTVQAIVARIISERPRVPSAQRKSVPPHVEAAVLRAIEKLPADRFGSAAQFAHALADEGHVGTLATPRGASAAPAARRSLLPWAVTAALGIVALLLAVQLRRDGSAPARTLVRASLLPPTGEEFSESYSFGAFSPDGRRFAFVLQSRLGVTHIWIRDVDQSDAKVLAGTDGAEAPFWSPDGRSIAYFSHGRLMRIGSDGGQQRDLCPAARVGGGMWSARGTILFSVESEIRRVAASGGACETVLRSSPGASARRPWMLPDERHFLYGTMGIGRVALFVGELGGAAPRLLQDKAVDPTFVSPDVVVYGDWAASRSSPLVAQRFDAGRLTLEGEPVRLTDGVRTAAGVFAYSVSGSGLLAYLPNSGDIVKLVTDARGVVLDTVRQLATWTHRQAWARATVAVGGAGLWLYDLQRKISTQLRDSVSRNPIWSPGDSVLVFGTSCSLHLFRLRTNTDTTIAARTSRCLFPSDWSRDGKTIVLTQQAGDSVVRSEIWEYNVAAGTLAPLLVGTANVSEGAISPDGRWLAYQSDESGTVEVFVRALRGQGVTTPVSRDGGRTPRWTHDGRELVFIAPDGRVMSAAITPGPELRSATPVEQFRAPGWSRNLFFETSGVPYDVSPDGARFVFRLPAASGAAAALLENWPALMTAKK